MKASTEHQLAKGMATPMISRSRNMREQVLSPTSPSNYRRFTRGWPLLTLARSLVFFAVLMSVAPEAPILPAARDYSLTEIINDPTIDSTQGDIAFTNLLCAVDLPGAENLDVKRSLSLLDEWAARVRWETDRNLHRFRANPGDYSNSEAYFRVLMLVTVLQQDLGVHYNLDRIDKPDFSNSKDLFINGMIGSNNGGTCVSMSVLYIAVARRLGYPLKLVVTKGHVFARWDGAHEHFNIDGAGQGLHTDSDEVYKGWPYSLTDAELNNGWFLRSLSPAEELAVFLMQRGHCLEDNGRFDEARAMYADAQRLAPSPEPSQYHAMLMRKEVAASQSPGRNSADTDLTRTQRQEWLKQNRREAAPTARQIIERQRVRCDPARGRPPT